MILCDKKHLASDTSLDELNEFADRLGIKRTWIHRSTIVHYDVWGKKLSLVLENGAVLISTKELVKRCRLVKV
jgi:hypothetical protein